MRHTHILGLVLLTIAVGACGDESQESPYRDCRNPDLSCYEPFVCSFSEELNQAGCVSPEGTTVSCTGQMLGPLRLMETTLDDLLLHWAGTTCVATSYDPGLAEFADDIAEGVDAWAQLSCMELCLQPPTETDREPEIERAERRIHFSLSENPQNAPLWISATYEQSTGRLVSVVIEADPDGFDELTTGSFVRAVGYGLGLSPARSESILDGDAISDDAQYEVCQVYGSTALCGD